MTKYQCSICGWVYDPAQGDALIQRRAQGKNRKDWGRFAVEWHKKFAIPAACLVFGLLGLALSLGSKKEARSSAFALSIAVIFVYYVFMYLGESLAKGKMVPAWLAMWIPNVVLGIAGVDNAQRFSVIVDG